MKIYQSDIEFFGGNFNIAKTGWNKRGAAWPGYQRECGTLRTLQYTVTTPDPVSLALETRGLGLQD